jgi:predicted RNA-binding protein with EMAP domain
MDKIKNNLIYVVTGFVLLCFLQTCGTRGKIIDNKKEIEALNSKIDSLTKVVSNQKDFDEDMIEYKMEQTMYKFLIYEEDLDRGKISLSEIKNRIDE